MTEKPNNSIVSLAAISKETGRVRAIVDICSDHTNPNVSLSLFDANEIEISHAVIMETNVAHIEFTLHVRAQNPTLPLSLKCATFKEEEDLPFDSQVLLIDSIE